MKYVLIIFFVLCKSVWSTDKELVILKDLPASFNQINDLAEAVCSDLFLGSVSIELRKNIYYFFIIAV